MKKIKCEIYTRVVGYFRPVQNWNGGKAVEFADRKEFCEQTSLATARRLSRTSLAHEANSAHEANPICETQPVHETQPAHEKLALNDQTSVHHALRYEIFTLPNCDDCASVKKALSSKKMSGQEFDLSDIEGLTKARTIFKNYRTRINRNSDGTMPLPLVLFYDQNNHVHDIVQGVAKLENIV